LTADVEGTAEGLSYDLWYRRPSGRPTMRRRALVLALLVAGLGLLSAFDVLLAAGPAFGLSLAAAWLVRPSD
jgi:hypothetical protein